MVLVGDAGEKAMGEMRVVVEQVLAGLGYGDVRGEGVVRDEIEGGFVGSVGAAKRGREMVVERERGRERGRGHGEL